MTRADDIRLLVTGGSGMVGQWSLHYLNELAGYIDQRVRVSLMTRSVSTITQRIVASLGNMDLTVFDPSLIEHHVATFRPTHVWHFSAVTSENKTQTLATVRSADRDIAERIVVALCRAGISSRVIYTSSGAVYGRNLTSCVPSSECDMPTRRKPSPTDLYGVVKRETEDLILEYVQSGFLTAAICRLFAFVGPLVPLDKHFAIGNFVNSAIRGAPIILRSSGKDFRSWLYTGDLARYLVALTFLQENQVVNVGSSEFWTIKRAAELIAEIAGVSIVERHEEDKTRPATYYLPDVSLLNRTVQLDSILDLRSAIRSTLDWYSSEQFKN